MIVGFKIGTNKKNVLTQALKLQKEHNLDYVIANTTSSLNQDNTQAWLVNGSNIMPFEGSKQHFSRFIFNHLLFK